MKIVIPMSGLGKRFADSGYKDIKPLIKVHGMPIIEWVLKLFPGDNDFVFICREEHLKVTPLMQVLKRIAPTAEIVSIKAHKLGPVYAVTQAFDFIKEDEEVIVNYCDFFQDWDFEDFKKFVKIHPCDGAIPCYTGFHPHLIHKENLYASCAINENFELQAIREKHSFEEDKFKAHHSGGTYYFSKGEYVKQYFTELIEKEVNLNGEYYVSLVYNLMLEDNKKILIYNKVPHFCQWGTPKDLEEYLTWDSIIKHYHKT
jgi:NDP-sugar pyrophosphorylase family protein